jgi:hypothetical protein
MSRRFAKALFSASLLWCGVMSLSPAAWAAERQARCPPSQTRSEPSAARDPDVAKLSRDDPIRVAFEGKRGMTDKTVIVGASPPLAADADVFAEIESDFERGDGGDTFPLEAISVSARVTRAGNVRVFVCLDSDQPEFVQTGRYLGAIRLIGSDVESLAIPIEVTLKDPGWKAVLWIAFGLLFGLGLKTATDFNTKGTSLSREALKDFGKQPAPYLAILTGVVGGFLSYSELYAGNPAWGTNPDHVKLMLSAVAVQVTGMTATDLISPYTPGRGRNGERARRTNERT